MLMIGIAVNCSLARNRQVLLLEGIDEWGVVHAFGALPTSEDQRVLRNIPSEAQRGAFTYVKIHVVLKLNCACEELAARDHHPTSAGFRAGSNASMKCFSVVGLVIAFGAVLGNVEFAVWELGRLDPRENSWDLIPDGSRARCVRVGSCLRQNPSARSQHAGVNSHSEKIAASRHGTFPFHLNIERPSFSFGLWQV